MNLREGIYSLPVLRALRKPVVGRRVREILRRRAITDEDERTILAMIRKCGTGAEVLDLARAHAARARSALGKAPDLPAG